MSRKQPWLARDAGTKKELACVSPTSLHSTQKSCGLCSTTKVTPVLWELDLARRDLRPQRVDSCPTVAGGKRTLKLWPSPSTLLPAQTASSLEYNQTAEVERML